MIHKSQNFPKPARVLLMLALMLAAAGCGGSGEPDGERPSFIQIGEFTINHLPDDQTEVRDGAGRKLLLIPREAPAPPGWKPEEIVRVPVRRVAAYGFFDIAALRTLGVLDTLVGVTAPREDWYVEEVQQGMDEGRIAFLGNSSSIDFERLKSQQPELVLTWDPSIIPMLTELGIPCAVTTTPVAMCLNARVRYVQFLAPFFNREIQAEEYFHRISESLRSIRERTAASAKEPKVMWGDIYEKRVLVEPGNSWVGELVGLVQSDYLFEDVYGTSCIEISIERFLYSGQDADIYFTYRSPKTGATSRAALLRQNSLLKGVRPLEQGKVYAPLPHYSQSGDRLYEILTEIAAILHPDCYPDHHLSYFMELPATDPPKEKSHS